MEIKTQYDVIIAGGGPAGAAAATILAQKGWRVAIFEKCKFPRYHIGESMIPFCWHTLERLGMVEKMHTGAFQKKHSVQFVNLNGNISQPFYFAQHYDHPSSTTWQVRRDLFDQMMLDNAREKGAAVFEETTVKRLIEKNGVTLGAEVETKNGNRIQVRATVTLDATGRDALAMTGRRWRVQDTFLKKVALWTYYKGAKRDQGIDEGATTVAYLPEKGWFWYIPMQDDQVSVGLVAEADYLFDETKDPATIFAREVPKNPWIQNHLAVGRPSGQFQITSDFSYRAKYCAADGLVLVGDAFSFLDPVFSSGLFLALTSGEMAGDAVDAALVAGDVSAKQFGNYGEKFRQAIEAMRKLIYAFYDPEFSFASIVKNHPQHQGDLTDCLIGNVFKDLSGLFEAVAQYADIPAALEHGMPVKA